MTSEIPIISKFIHKKYRSLLECSTTNVKLFDGLLSPIIENSTDMLSTPMPIDNLCSNASQKLVLTNDNRTIDEFSHILCQSLEHYNNIQNYLNKLEAHFSVLSKLVQHLKNNKNLTNLIELIEARLLQMNVKRNQINHLINHFSVKDLTEKTSPFILKAKSMIDYNELLTSIQFSMNQKTTLIDHLKNEYRYTKYHLNEYSLKLQHRRNVLMKLTEKIEQFLIQQSRIAKETDYISRNNHRNRRHIELMQLSNEYEQLQKENYLLTVKAKENLERFSMLMQSNQHEIGRKSHI